MQHQSIVAEYERLMHSESFKIRVTHHDTKISNVLFDAGDNSVCVIDLDTVMPGHFISDVGDMLRTYLSPYGEEEQDFSKIQIRDDYFDAIVRGYLGEMNTELTDAEKNAFVFAGKFLIYMQAVRFLTDYLNNDVYYGVRYEGHNLVRAQNQAELLQRLCEREGVLQAIVANASTKL
jgi:Ser/Thr protein kinase RdoA (MazF antagonist)